MINLLVFGIIILTIFLYFVFKSDRNKLFDTVTKSHRGTKTERDLINKLLNAEFPPQTIFHDLYVRNRFGNYAQIDAVLATKVGLIVFEVKDYSGWIFGTGNNLRWTQVLDYGRKKYSFYNPILQNRKHIEELRTKLTQFQNIPFYSIIVFYGDCELKEITAIPENTFVVKSDKFLKLVRSLMDEETPAYYKSKRDVVTVLSNAVANGDNEKICEKHSNSIKKRYGNYN